MKRQGSPIRRFLASPRGATAVPIDRGGQPQVLDIVARDLRVRLDMFVVTCATFSFGVPDDESIAQEPAWTYPLVALLPPAHELATRDVLSVTELLAFPVIACHLGRLPGLRQQMDAVHRQHVASPVIAGEARTLAGGAGPTAGGECGPRSA